MRGRKFRGRCPCRSKPRLARSVPMRSRTAGIPPANAGKMPAVQKGSGPELVRQILETVGDKGKIVLGLEVAALFRAVLVGAGDEGGLHAVRGGVHEIAVMRRDHHYRARI